MNAPFLWHFSPLKVGPCSNNQPLDCPLLNSSSLLYNRSMRKPMNQSTFYLLLMTIICSACVGGEGAGGSGSGGGTTSVVSNIQNDPDLNLASDVLESMDTAPVVANKGSADVVSDVVLGPTFELDGDSRVLIFSYDRTNTLQWSPKPFFISELNLHTYGKTQSQVLPDSAGFMGLVSKYSLNLAQNKIRILTTTPFNIIDWDYQNKVGTLIKAVTTNTAPLFHHYDLTSDNFCAIDKLGTAYRLHTIKNGTYSMHALSFLGTSAPLALICEDNHAYLSVKSTSFKLYALNLSSNTSQIINDLTNPASALSFYDILGEQYARLTTVHPITHKNIATNYKLNGTNLGLVAALPTAPVAKTFDIKLNVGRATLADPRVPVRIKQLKPTVGTLVEVKVSFNTRPEVISNLFARNSQLYLAGKAISKYTGGHFTKLGNPYSLIMNNLITVNDKFFMTNGSSQLYLYDPSKSWTWEPNYLTTIASSNINANPKLVRDFKTDGIVAIKKILPYEDNVVIGGTVTAKTKSRFVLYDTIAHTLSSGPSVAFDINDFLINEDKIYATTYNGVATQKVFFALFDAPSVGFEVQSPTVYPGNQLIKIFHSPNGYYLSSTKQFVRLNDSGVQNQTKTLTTVFPKFIKTPNNKFLTIFNNKLVLVKADGNYDTITDLAPLNILINDIELLDNKLYIATKYGMIYEIKIPLATITLND